MMITYAEVKRSPSGWLDAEPDPQEDVPMTDFELALSELIDQYRNKVNKHYVSKCLASAGDIIEKDEGWIYDETNTQPEPEAEPPVLATLTPNTAVVGSPAVAVTATGSGFTAESVIAIEGIDETTNFVSATELSLTIDATTEVEGVVQVTVRNGDVESAPLDFTFTAA
jgi:IPT/TIG domain